MNAFRSEWLTRFQLPARGWIREARTHLARLPFPRTDDLGLLRFLFDDLPLRVGRSSSPEYSEVAEAYGWLCLQFWQAEAAFPSYSEAYAAYLQTTLRRKRPNTRALVLARMINRQEDPGRCGFNQLLLSDLDAVRKGEAWKKKGHFEPFLKARAKYEEYVDYLENHAGFRVEWEALKAAFPRQAARKGILHRSLVPERSWYQGRGARFATAGQQFQALFDVLCWKYYLWGIADGRPLLMKPAVAATPYGTQIFIPGYLSFDAKRDLDLALISRLHRARGAARQGPAFLEARRAELRNRKQAAELDAQARRHGLRGDARWRFVTTGLGWVDTGDYRETRRLLEVK